MADFRSDNVAGAAPEVLAAVMAAAGNTAAPYGEDPWTGAAERALAALFERPVAVVPVISGTAANGLALAAAAPPWGAVFCHASSHLLEDECGAPEFFTSGARLVSLGGRHGRFDAATLAAALARYETENVHSVQPAAVSLTQATEAGTVYTPDQIAAIARAARARDLAVHMDGARFANAVAHLGCTPAEITWKAGVDLLSLGFTKNGAIGAEAVVVFDPARAAGLAYRRKRAGHLVSKMRFVSAQIEAMLTDGLWLRLAQHANRLARLLAGELASLPGVRIIHPVEANEVFAIVPRPMADLLQRSGHRFHTWNANLPEDLTHSELCLRLVTSFASSAAEVADFIAAARNQHN